MESVCIYKGIQENIVNKYVIIFGNLTKFSHFCLYWSYSWYQMSDSPFKFGGTFYTKNTRKIYDIYVGISVPILKFSYIHW